MNQRLQLAQHLRRDFLTSSASGLGGLALASMSHAASSPNSPLTAKYPHRKAPIKNCIFFYMAGAPSHIDLFDPKPKLNELHGKGLPDNLLKGKRFAFIQKDSAVLMGSKRQFKKHGQSGMEFSDLLPHIGTCADDICMIRSMHTDQFNHHPGQLLMQTGTAELNHPSIGSWLSYGLGSENQNLPSYVVLTAGRGASGGTSLWQSGFLPSSYEGVLFRSKGTPVLNLNNPAGISSALQRKGLDTLAALNQQRAQLIQDHEINSRIANYELAYRMQSAAPELSDISDEPQYIKEMYGLGRDGGKKGGRGGSGEDYHIFAKDCLLARRMVERGVRFVNVVHASWDHHSNLDRELEFNARMVDQPIAALIKDLKQRGLLESTLVVFCSEFGRTPLGENRQGREANTGRDHHPDAFSIFMAGGGVKGGLTYGATDDIAWSPIENPVHANDFQATLLHLFGMDHNRLTYRHKGVDQKLTTITRQAKVIHDILA